MDSPSSDSTEQSQAAGQQAIDALTVTCIAIVSYLVAAVIHEGLGHGLTAIMVVARDIHLSGAVLRMDGASVSQQASRIIRMSGPLAGLLVGLLQAPNHGRTRSKSADFRYFLCLTAYVCLFANCGYMMALSFVPFGDMHGIVQGRDTPFAWRLSLTVAGTVVSVGALFVAARTLDEFLGRTERRARAVRLVLISYFAGSIPLILSTLLGKEGSYVAMVSATPATREAQYSCLIRLCWWARPNPGRTLFLSRQAGAGRGMPPA
jgi:hypothetical protein